MPNPALQALLQLMPSHGSFTDPLEGDPNEWVRDAPNVNMKGSGYLGLLKMNDGTGRTMSEKSIADSPKLMQQGPPPENGVADDRWINYPSVVPTLSHDQLSYLLGGGDAHRPDIAQTAEDFALQRKAQGLPLFAQPGETNENILPEFERQRLQLMPSHSSEAEPQLNYLQRAMSHAEGIQPPQGKPWDIAASRAEGIRPTVGEQPTYPTADTPLAEGWLADKLNKLDPLANSGPGPSEAVALPFGVLKDYLNANAGELIDRTGSKLLQAFQRPELVGSDMPAILASGMRPAKPALTPLNFPESEYYKFIPGGRAYNPLVDDKATRWLRYGNNPGDPNFHMGWSKREAQNAVQGLYDASQTALQDLGIHHGDTVTLHRAGTIPATPHFLTPTHVDPEETAMWDAGEGNHHTYEVPREAIRALVGLLHRGDDLTAGEMLVPSKTLMTSHQGGSLPTLRDPDLGKWGIEAGTMNRIPSWLRNEVLKTR